MQIDNNTILDIQKKLIQQIHLDEIDAKIFLLVTTHGKTTAKNISTQLDIPHDTALRACHRLVDLGGFINMDHDEFEAMHPRFTIVNMYRRMCTRENIVFGRNKIVDGIGVRLERCYDDARTK